jgi:formate hydrogenlyase transcriptional activator
MLTAGETRRRDLPSNVMETTCRYALGVNDDVWNSVLERKTKRSLTMSAPSFGLDTFTPPRSRAKPDRVSRHFTDDAASRASTGINEELDEETLDLRDEVLSTSMFEEIVGSSGAICGVTAQVMRVAPSDATVLITGESGTGKELIARAIHKRSCRSRSVFTRMNCAVTPSSLIAAELFGYEKGAFTGAGQRHAGRFEVANHGTIFLDEIGEMPSETQVALLRVLQEREFERVGGTQSIPVDVRVIAATNCDLPSAIRSGKFRLDLFYRLNVFPIHVPPLRERPEDILLLAKYFIERYAAKEGKRIRRVEKRTAELLEGYHWPGNIRELQNVIERAMILCDSDTFFVEEAWLRQPEPEPRVGLQPSLINRERELIEAALAETRGRIAGLDGAARRLGVPRSTLEYRIQSLGIDKYRYRVDTRELSCKPFASRFWNSTPEKVASKSP